MKFKRTQFWLRVMLALASVVLLASVAMLAYREMERRLNTGVSPSPSPSPAAGELTDVPAKREPGIAEMFASQGELGFVNMDGAKVSLRELEGDVKALYFFTSYCPYCQEELKQSVQFERTLGEVENARMYLVDRLDAERETRRNGIDFYQKEGLPFPLLFDEGRAVFDRLGLGIVPSALFFDAENRLTSYAIGATLTPQALKAHLLYAKAGGEDATRAFVLDQLMGEDGGVRSRYRGDGDEVLCESQGLLMAYAVRAGDRALFERALHRALEMRDGCGLMSWRTVDGVRAGMNATLDDLRVLGALMDARDRWGGYDDEIDSLSAALLGRCAPDRELRDFYDWESGKAAATLSLCYVDANALSRLAEQGGAWRAVKDKAQALLKGGYISDDFPLYHPRYDYAEGRYAGGELHAAEAMLALVQLARMDALPQRTREFVMECLRGDGIFARYTLSGSVPNGYRYESTAIYALAVLLASELNDPEMERLALARMEKARVFDVGTPMDGAYGARTGDDLYAFDQLTALLAWQAVSGA